MGGGLEHNTRLITSRIVFLTGCEWRGGDGGCVCKNGKQFDVQRHGRRSNAVCGCPDSYMDLLFQRSRDALNAK